MSRQKAHVTPLRGPASKLQPYASTTAHSSGLGDTPELPPQNTQRNSRSEGATSARTKAMDSSATANAYNQTLKQDGSALRLVSASDSELLSTSKPMSLKEFSKGKSVRDLPCLVKVVAGHHSLCERYSFCKEQMFVILEKKKMRVVTCKDHKGGSSYAVPLNTTAFHLVPFCTDDGGIHPQSFGKITASELLLSKALPPVIAVSEEFEVSEGRHSKKTVPVGTLLFPKERKQSRDRRQLVLRAKSEGGEMVQITQDCIGCFSILAYDVKLSLRQALDHFKPPFTMQTISDCDDLYMHTNVVTVERVHKEDVFIGMMKATEGTSIDDVSTFSRMAEVPVCLNLTVVTMVPRQREILGQIYDFVFAVTMNRPAMSLSNPAATDPVSSVKLATPFAPSARVLPSTPVQLSVAPPNDREEHIYDATDNLEAMPENENQQKTPPDSEAVVTTFQSDPPPSDAAAIDFYDVMPTATTTFKSAPSTPSATTLPSTPLHVQLSEGAPNDKDEHIYDAVDNYKAIPTGANLQMASPNSEAAGKLLRTDQPPSDAVAVDYYEEMPATANQQRVYPDSMAAGTSPFESSQIPSDPAVDYYEDVPTTGNQQRVYPDSMAAGTSPFVSDQPPSDAVAADYYEEMPTTANQQRVYPDSVAVGTTPFVSGQYLLEENVPTYMKLDNFIEDTDANIAYLKKMQSGDILQLLDAMNLSVYKEAFEQEQIDGKTMACLSADMLSELGVSKALHRLRLMKIIHGRTSVGSFICVQSSSSV